MDTLTGKEFRLYRYTNSDASEWDTFVRNSRNGTFLFERGYMDYHSDRFMDHSLIARKGGRIMALLPANLLIDTSTGNRVLQSHGGLTYGGWILPQRHSDALDLMKCFSLLQKYATRERISAFDYKPIPYIYQKMPSQEDLYVLFRQGAILKERNLSCCIDLTENPGFNKQQKRHLRKAEMEGCKFYETKDCKEFHALLSDCLAERHRTRPVHTLEELELLHRRFPNIRIFMLDLPDGTPQAGVCIYETEMVAHVQYICSSPEARSKGLLTFLFNELIRRFAHCRYFDFGISNEDHGLYLNEGLYRQKASLGGSGVAYDRYMIFYK